MVNHRNYYKDLDRDMDIEELYRFLTLLLDMHITTDLPRMNKDDAKEYRQEFILAKRSLDIYLK